ncbi:nicotinamide-nucleotide amidohydrolase family protein [uncultured Mitsuokella sp.]|uniref:CinA family protein n=1 Tax=uncultured Mitsuokella sp. TaxID=453120 RepID=UPI002613EB57|nr:nicotinamide-nucleotide amidohydrolase family protein [uncultured Mitsuokella sp.]
MNEKKTLEMRVGELLTARGLTIACAESCTGGLLTSRLTDVAGSSAYVMGSVVSYTNAIKERLVGVRHETLAAHGAVSEETAREMAEGIRHAIRTDIGVGITGIAGPGGGTVEKPVGLVFIAISGVAGIIAHKKCFTGTRVENKRSSTESALSIIVEYLEKY